MTDDRNAGKAKTQQAENMEKALRMKKEAGEQTHIPEHRTAGEGPVKEAQVSATDARAGKEGTHTENVSRSHGARVGDAGKTTGPGRQ